jgi:hypothetical protein
LPFLIVPKRVHGIKVAFELLEFGDIGVGAQAQGQERLRGRPSPVEFLARRRVDELLFAKILKVRSCLETQNLSNPGP